MVIKIQTNITRISPKEDKTHNGIFASVNFSRSSGPDPIPFFSPPLRSWLGNLPVTHVACVCLRYFLDTDLNRTS